MSNKKVYVPQEITEGDTASKKDTLMQKGNESLKKLTINGIEIALVKIVWFLVHSRAVMLHATCTHSLQPQPEAQLQFRIFNPVIS